MELDEVKSLGVIYTGGPYKAGSQIVQVCKIDWCDRNSYVGYSFECKLFYILRDSWQLYR